MSRTQIAERYARAVFELAVEANQLTQITSQVQGFADTVAGSPELRTVLESPVVAEAARDGLIKDVAARLGAGPLALNALRMMGARRRLGLLPEVARALTRLSDDRAGVFRATVTSAKPLPEDYYQRLAVELEKRTHRKIVIERKQDPSLIAGVVTRIGDHTIDGSLKGRLAALERVLLAST